MQWFNNSNEIGLFSADRQVCVWICIKHVLIWEDFPLSWEILIQHFLEVVRLKTAQSGESSRFFFGQIGSLKTKIFFCSSKELRYFLLNMRNDNTLSSVTRNNSYVLTQFCQFWKDNSITNTVQGEPCAKSRNETMNIQTHIAHNLQSIHEIMCVLACSLKLLLQVLVVSANNYHVAFKIWWLPMSCLW